MIIDEIIQRDVSQMRREPEKRGYLKDEQRKGFRIAWKIGRKPGKHSIMEAQGLCFVVYHAFGGRGQ